MMSRRAVRMFDQGRFNVKVIVQGYTLYDLGPLPSSITALADPQGVGAHPALPNGRGPVIFYAPKR